MSWKDLFGSGGGSAIPWETLKSETQIDEILEASNQKPQLIFKHSTRCSISSMAKSRLEREWNLENVQPWYLDLIAYRSISNAIADKLNVTHESPQAILLVNGNVTYHSSHNSISVAEMETHIK